MRSQQKVEQLGLEPMTAGAIRKAVLQAQLSESNHSTNNLSALPEEALQRQPNGVWLLHNLQGFELNVAPILAGDPSRRPLVLRHCRDFRIHADGQEVEIPESWDGKRLILIDQCENFVVDDLKISGSRNPLTLNRCRHFLIERLVIKQARGYGLSLLRSQAGTIKDSLFFACLASGINIVGNSLDLHLQQCQILESRGIYNWDAGINCMHCSPAVTLQQIPEASHEALDLRDKGDTPQRIWIDSCTIGQCQSQGIYLEGAAQILVENCLIRDNNKEGICFDWGTAYSYLRHSQLIRNGERADYDDTACAVDFLPTEFRDSDGRHFCQLPGISIDNGYANTIEHNLITANYGGGIKIVRSAFNNLIRFNSIGGNSNRLGLNNKSEPPVSPYRPSEIKLLNMGPGTQQEFIPEQAHLDFLPPEGNCIYGNLLRTPQHSPDEALYTWNDGQAMQANQINI